MRPGVPLLAACSDPPLLRRRPRPRPRRPRQPLRTPPEPGCEFRGSPLALALRGWRFPPSPARRRCGARTGARTNMEGGGASPGWDSDETVVEASVADSDLEEEELPWRRLLLDQDTSLRSVCSLHPGTSTTWKGGTASPEIQLVFKLREDLKKLSENKMPLHREDEVLQKPQDEMEQNQVLLQTRENCPKLTEAFNSQADLTPSHQSVKEPGAGDDSEISTYPEKELSEDRGSVGTCLLSGTFLKVSDMALVKDKLLIEPEKMLTGSHVSSEPVMEVTLERTSEEEKSEENSLETFVSALEMTKEDRLLEIMSDLEPTELMNPLSSAPNSIAIPLTIHRGLSENTSDNAFPAELLAALNTMSESQVTLSCQREESSSLCAGGKRLVGKWALSQTGEDCAQISEESVDAHACTPLFEQDSKLAQLQDEHLSVQSPEGQNSFEVPILVHPNVALCDPLNNAGNSNSDQDASDVLRRSATLQIGGHGNHSDDACAAPEKTFPKLLGHENQANSNPSSEGLRMQNPAFIIEAKEKNVYSPRSKSGEQIRKSKTLAKKYENMRLNDISLSAINRRNAFGENLLYRAALHDNTDLVLLCLKKGGNVNQQSYAGWTALHEACVGGFYQTASELIKGGADVNSRGMYQITPLRDAVVNGHYKVAELLLSNGADPLFRSDSGKCALDEAKDSRMKCLLENYISKRQRPLSSAQNSLDPASIEDAHQCKKPKYCFRKCTGYTSDENFNIEKPEHVDVHRKSKEYLRLSQENVYENYEKGSRNIRLDKSKHKQLTVNDTHSRGLRKDNLPYVNDSSSDIPQNKGVKNMRRRRTRVGDAVLAVSSRSDVPQDKGVKNTRRRWTRVGDAVLAVSSRKTTGVSSARAKRLAIDRHHDPQALDDFPRESHKPGSLTLSSLKSELGNNIETYSFTTEKHTPDLDSSNSQEINNLELKSIDQAEAIYFSGISLHKELKLSLVCTEEQPHAHKEKQQISSREPYENSGLGQKEKSVNKWEKSFPSFKANTLNGKAHHCPSEETVAAEMVMRSVDCKTRCDHKEEKACGGEMDLQPPLRWDDHLSQGSELKADALTAHPQQEAAPAPDSGSAVVSGQHVAGYDRRLFGASFDHSHSNFVHTSLAHTRTFSTHEVSELASQVELFEKTQACSSMVPAPSVTQADTHIVGKLKEQEETPRSYSDKSPGPGSSNRPLPTGQVVETVNVEERREDLADSEIICSMNFHSTDIINEDSTSMSQLNQREVRKASHKPDEELTNIKDEIAIRNCEVEEVRRESRICTPTCVQEHKNIKNFSPNLSLLKDTCSQEMKAAGVPTRDAAGESQPCSAARRGNVSALVEPEAGVNFNDNAGRTRLHEAVSRGAKDVIEDVSCEKIGGILPLRDTVANSYLKTAEILLQHGANPNQKAAAGEAGDVPVEELPTPFGAVDTDDSKQSRAADTVQIPSFRLKGCNQHSWDGYKTVYPPSLTHQAQTGEIHSVHQTISVILQSIEEEQENLLAFEVKTPEDAEDYIEKMSAVKEIMESVLDKQKAERDDLAKKYRVSMESFKHGVLREQLANLATRQKKLLAVAQKQKEIRLKIQNYKDATSSCPGLTLKKQLSSTEDSSYRGSQELPSAGQSVQSPVPELSPDSLEDDTQLSQDMWSSSQPPNMCLHAEAMRKEDVSGKELNCNPNINKRALGGPSECGQPYRAESLSESLPFVTQAGHSQHSRALVGSGTKGSAPSRPSAESSTPSRSDTLCLLAQSKAQSPAVACHQALSSGDPKNRNRKTASQQPPRRASESCAREPLTGLGRDVGQQIKPYLQKSAPASPHTDDSQGCCSEPSPARSVRRPGSHSTAPRRKRVQIKDLIVLGRISPGDDVLEFKTQVTTHKASVLVNGKIKVESGQMYQNPVTWLKDLLGGARSVTWNYAWRKVTYLGTELLKCIPEEEPVPPEASPEGRQQQQQQQQQLCLPGVSRESMQSIPHYLQISEILLISDQEFLPRHIMDEHWKFYTECEELAF